MSTYSEKLRHPKWQKKRLEILNRDNFTCKMCNDTETELHIHHLEYNGDPHEVSIDKLLTVCKHCHFILEDAKKQDINVIKIEDGGWYKIAMSKNGIAYYSLDYGEPIRFLISFRYNSASLKHLYKLSIKK
jgi:hypothetical protein